MPYRLPSHQLALIVLNRRTGRLDCCHTATDLRPATQHGAHLQEKATLPGTSGQEAGGGKQERLIQTRQVFYYPGHRHFSVYTTYCFTRTVYKPQCSATRTQH
ncbi:hypothetical protein BaRGS_00007074 [Batillaria attramentaria]|uniref:Secreted protein n=1 Tax=Batillaria attramentaria TaxID=370345 RepID=A0ABD0LQX4_9CAEN